jgi:hypothetical protein
MSTAGVDELIGTAGNDTFEGLVEDLSIFDDLDGGAGDDVLNLYVEDLEGVDSVDSSGAVDVEGIETINFIYTGEAVGTGTIDGDTFQGATQIWQIGGDNDLEDLAATQTAGFRDTDVNTTVNAADDVTSATVALDGVASGAALTFTGADLETVSVSGDVEASGASDGTLELTFNSDATDEVTTVNLALTNDTELLANGTWNDVVTVDASASTGGITATLSGTDAFEAISGGSGDDNLTIGTDFTADEVTINAGAGDDTIAINGTSGVLLTLTGGAGTDTHDFSKSGFKNIVNEETFEDEMIVITDFNTNEDVLDLSGLVEHELSNAELGIGSADDGILNAATLEAAVTLASGATAAGEFSLFNYGDDAYALYQAVGTENGGLIKLTGVNNIDALDGSALLSGLEAV